MNYVAVAIVSAIVLGHPFNMKTIMKHLVNKSNFILSDDKHVANLCSNSS